MTPEGDEAPRAPDGGEAAPAVTPALACRRCGTPYVGAFCAVCGHPRAEDRVVVAEPPPAAPSASDADPAALARRRRRVVVETWVVLAAFWFPATVGAIVGFARSYAGDATTRFPSVVSGHPLENMLLSCLAYLTVGAVVPVVLLLLLRSGETTRSLGLWPLTAKRDVMPAVGLAVAAFAAAVFFGVILVNLPGVSHLRTYSPSLGRLPGYYVVEALILSATTAVVEEVVMNGFLVTRLSELGMGRGRVLWLCTALRVCYHAYYGWGVVLIVPFCLILTGDFLLRRRLSRVIGAHFVYDFTLMTIAILR